MQEPNHASAEGQHQAALEDIPGTASDTQEEPDWTFDADAYERAWAAWNDPVRMQQRAAQAEAEAKSEAMWQEDSIGLSGAPWAEPEAGQ